MQLIFLPARSATLALAAVSPVFITLSLLACLWKTRSSFRRSALYCARFALGFGLVDWVLLGALPLLGLSFGPLVLPLAAWWGLRYLLFMGWAVASRWLSNTPDRLAPTKNTFAALNLALMLLLLYSFYYEPFNLGVTVLEETSDQPIPPIRIVQVSDLHLERSTFREQKLVDLVKQQDPDIILLTGDYLNLSNLNDPLALEQARQVLAQLEAPLGVYAVNGTVDSAYLMRALFDGLEITVLNDETRTLPLSSGSLTLVGITDRHTIGDGDRLASLMKKVPRDAYSILLYHTPDLIETAARAGVNLYFAGHTHGGQVRLPFYGALVTLSRYGKRYEMGNYVLDGTHLYVSRGIGMEGALAPRMRFLCPPEIVVMDIKGNP